METESNEVTRALDDLGGALRGQPSVRNEVMRRVTQHAATGGSTTGSTAQWRGRRLLGKLAAVAACAVVALLIWNPWGNGIGAGEAFAAAIAKVESAGTFACRQIVTQIGADGEPDLHEMTLMYKEPNLERIEYGEGMPMAQVMVTDYDKKVRLIALPDDKTAMLQDLQSTYTTDEKTGSLKSLELWTHARNDVQRLSAQAVKDLGHAKLNGQDVWVLQSADGAEPVKTVYVNPIDGKPVQVELAWPSKPGQSFVYTDIQIDTPLDDGLFSLAPPEGYAMQHDGPVKPVDEMNGKIMAKMMRLSMECIKYMGKHDGRWPETLDDLRAAGTDAQKLQTLLAAPDSKDGKPVILYRKPRQGETDAIVLYEAPEIRRKGSVVCGFTDGHSEIVSTQRFNELMKQEK